MNLLRRIPSIPSRPLARYAEPFAAGGLANDRASDIRTVQVSGAVRGGSRRLSEGAPGRRIKNSRRRGRGVSRRESDRGVVFVLDRVEKSPEVRAGGHGLHFPFFVALIARYALWNRCIATARISVFPGPPFRLSPRDLGMREIPEQALHGAGLQFSVMTI